MKLYCLKIERACPDYKRPYCSVSVHHYLTIEEADEKRRREKQKYYKDFLTYLDECGEEVPKDVDEIDEDEAQDYFYRDSYMDMMPFDCILYVIEIQDDSITSKTIPFPKSEKLDSSM